MPIKIKEEDLVLKVSPSYNPNNFNIYKYEAFIDKLCGTREYQKEAIKQACIYLLGGRYSNLIDLAEENFKNNNILQEKHDNYNNFEDKLHLRNKLSCNIDLATGTGKSYVIYGIAQIMLCEGKIDKVLVLAPSITIEDGLTTKFKALSSDKNLKDLLPKDSFYKNPTIIQATKTIENGHICIENIHSTYKNTSSAIKDSVLGLGERTLILNDEAHHIYSKANANVKKWHEFLSDKEFNFKYIVGFTGTPYIENEYFTDIIYRYSIIEGMENKFIKKVNYIKDTDINLDSSGRMQLILENHNNNITTYNKVKPISILISKDIKHCEKDKKELINFLHKKEGLSIEELENKVLIVTSDKKHINNLEILKTVGDRNNPVEWICSVAMLTEGWDVPNVFQVIPSEERAFKSKLLISQVIGRGLRIPEEYKGENLILTVLNHKKFNDNITHLVDEILEKEEKIFSYPIEEKKDYNFPIYNLIYNEEQIEESIKTDYKVPNIKKEFNLYSEDNKEEVNIKYATIGSENETDQTIIIEKETKTIDELTNEILNKIKAWCIELEAEGVDECELEKIEDLNYDSIKNTIQRSLDKFELDNQKISLTHCTKILQGYGILKRFGNKVVRYSKEPKGIIKLDIYSEKKGLGKSGLSISTVKKDKAYIFYDENSYKYSTEQDIEALEILDDNVGKKHFININNAFHNKTPLNINIASSTPEKQFIDYLINIKYSDKIDGFFKSKDRGFYDFKYSWRKGEHNTFKAFNPDFFIKSGKQIIVVEIKGNETEKEYSRSYIQNKAKYVQAKKHFSDLNKILEKENINQKYYFTFCSPKDYRTLFKYLEKGKINKFTSRIEASFEDSLLKDNEIKQLEFFDDKELKNIFGTNWNYLEENSKIFLITAEKNYFDNKNNNKYNFSGGELIKAFELELRTKIFDRIREDEDISYKIIEEEKNNQRNTQKAKTIDYFNYDTEILDLGTMQMLLTFNKSLIKYITNNFSSFEFELGVNNINHKLIQEKNFNSIGNDFLKDLPNTIALVREKFRNADSHGATHIEKDIFEELRNIMIYGEGILIKLQDIN